MKYRRVYSHHFHTTIAESIHTTPNSIQCPFNCDETEKVGSEIQQSLDSVSVRNATINRRQVVHTLNELKPGVKVDKQTVQIDPSILFLRCTAPA